MSLNTLMEALDSIIPLNWPSMKLTTFGPIVRSAVSSVSARVWRMQFNLEQTRKGSLAHYCPSPLPKLHSISTWLSGVSHYLQVVTANIFNSKNRQGDLALTKAIF